MGLRRKASDVVEARCSERRERPAYGPTVILAPTSLRCMIAATARPPRAARPIGGRMTDRRVRFE